MSTITFLLELKTNKGSNLPMSELLVEIRDENIEKFGAEKLLAGLCRVGTPLLITSGISLSLTKKLSENPLLSNAIYSSKAYRVCS